MFSVFDQEVVIDYASTGLVLFFLYLVGLDAPVFYYYYIINHPSEQVHQLAVNFVQVLPVPYYAKTQANTYDFLFC